MCVFYGHLMFFSNIMMSDECLKKEFCMTCLMSLQRLSFSSVRSLSMSPNSDILLYTVKKDRINISHTFFKKPIFWFYYELLFLPTYLVDRERDVCLKHNQTWTEYKSGSTCGLKIRFYGFTLIVGIYGFFFKNVIHFFSATKCNIKTILSPIVVIHFFSATKCNIKTILNPIVFF